jgi:signal transduction histidine kinase
MLTKVKDGPDPAAPLWRAAQVFRLLSYLYAAWFEIASNGELARPALGWLLFGVLTAVTGACAVAYLQGFGRRPAWVVGEIVVVVLLMLSTTVVASDQWVADHQTWPTTLWATNATISAAILLGPTAGMLTGLVVMATGAVLKGHVNVDLGRNASIVVELTVGLAVGMAAQTARRAHAELTRVTRLSASLEERERLSRHVHDGVIQVLALVAKRGREIGGPTMELANLAAEQERVAAVGEHHRYRSTCVGCCAAGNPSRCRSACREPRCCSIRWLPPNSRPRSATRSTMSRHMRDRMRRPSCSSKTSARR